MKDTMFKKVKIARNFPENLQSFFVSDLLIQHEDENFVLSFFEMWPPAIIGETEEDVRSEIEKIDHIDAKCVSRLIITPNKMKSFIEAINSNFEKYENSKSGLISNKK